MRFEVSSFALQGVTLLPLPDVQAVLAPWLNRPINFAELEQALQAVAAYYQTQGWLARAQLPVQTLDEKAEVRIDVLEARMGQAQLAVQPSGDQADTPPRLPAERLQRLLQKQLPTGRPLRLADYERALSLVNDTPGVSATASLALSDIPGATDVIVTAKDKGLGSAAIVYDNSGSRSTGADRLNAQLSLDNPLRMGDQITLGLMASEGVRYERLGYGLPLGYTGLRAGVSASAMRYHLVGSFDTPGGTYGTAHTRGLNLSYPWLRQTSGNVNLGVNYTNADYVNFTNGVETSRKFGNTLGLTMGGDFYDDRLGGSTNLWGLSATRGRLVNRFTKFSANLARLQRLNETHSLWFSWNAQRALNNLDTSEKFSLGGAQGVRAYPGSQGSGDHGWLLTLESRSQIRPDLQAVVFYDAGHVTWSKDLVAVPPDNAQKLNSYHLRGAGLSLRYNFSSSTSANLTWSHRLGDNPVANTTTGADADGTRLLNRFWLNVSSFF